MRIACLASVFLCLSIWAGPLGAQERTLGARAVAEGVYVVTSSNPGDPNILAAVGSEGVLLVDGIASEAVADLLEAVRSASGLPVRDVVLTHWHPDHTLGNGALRAHGITVWAHENAQRRMREGNPIDFFGLQIAAYPAEALADEILTGPRTLHVGDHEVRLIPLAPAHTDGDVFVHLPRANVLHLGDVQLGAFFPFVELSSGGDADGLVAALDYALTLTDEHTVVVPGHGPVGGRAELAAFRDLLVTVWARVREGVAQGKSLEEVVGLRPAAEFDARWNTPVISTDRFVATLYQAASADSWPDGN